MKKRQKEVKAMKTKAVTKKITNEEYYDERGVLSEITEEDVIISLDEALERDIIKGKRRRKLQNVTIKLDPLYLVSIKKVATKKGIPYQTLVRQWVAEKIRKELKIA
jgi:predicted DNA binding CopG/RHH family protein